MNLTKQKSCPKDYLLEAYINDRLTTAAEKKKITDHLKCCFLCRALAHELRQLYLIFNNESSLPLHSSILKKIHQIDFGRVAITGILLKPVEPLNGHVAMAFHSKIVFSTQNFYQENLVDVNYLPTDASDILIRVIQSLATQETTFYIFSRTKKLYSHIQLRLDESEMRYKSDCCGKIELGKYDIRSLDNKIIMVTVEQ